MNKAADRIVGQRYACVHFPLWPIQRLVAAKPDLRKRNLALVQQDTRRGPSIYAASPAALRCGIRPEMTLTEARSLLRKNVSSSHPSELVFFDADIVADREALASLATQLQQFSPLVGLEEGSEPNSILLSLQGLERLFNSESDWSGTVRQWLAANQWMVRIAVAHTVGAALALAKFGRQPTNCRIAPKAHHHELLDNLPVEALRLPLATCRTLADLGVQTIGQLKQLPRPSLAARFGHTLIQSLDRFDGHSPEPIHSIAPPDDFTASLLLEHPIANRATLCEVVQQLVSRAAAMLELRQLGALQWHIRLDRYQAECVTLQINLYSAVINSKHMRQLIELYLDQFRISDSTENPITHVTVAAHECIPIVDRQLELFASSDGASNDSSTLAHLVNCLAARLGAVQIVRPQILAEAQPECAVRFYPLTGSRVPARKPRKTSSAAIPRPLERPLRLLRELVPISVWLDDSGQPCHLKMDGNQLSIEIAIGPERIETAWWRKSLVCRDYWRVQTNSSRRMWICQDLQTDRWFLHGIY